MKKMILGLIMFGMVGSTFSIDKAELDHRIRKLTAKLETMQHRLDKSIPPETLKKAQGVILLSRTKAGFIFAYQGGGGVALVKQPNSEQWSPAAFVAANEASLGLQLGGEQGFFVILLMNTNAIRWLTEGDIEFGGEAHGTAGNSSAVEEGNLSKNERLILVYDDRQGLYGGAAIKGGAITPDEKANRAYYGQFLTMKEILFGNAVKPTDTATELARKLNDYSKPFRGRD